MSQKNKKTKCKCAFCDEINFDIPEDIIEDSTGQYSGKVELSELLGSEYYLHFNVSSQDFVAKTNTDKKHIIGEEFKFNFNLSKAHIFCTLTGKTII